MSASQNPSANPLLRDIKAAAEALEKTLAEERAAAQKTEQDLRGAHVTYELLLRESEVRRRALEVQAQKDRMALEAEHARAKELAEKLEMLENVYRAEKNQIAQYRSAWNDVLLREKEAKEVLAESAKRSAELSRLEREVTRLTQELDGERAYRSQIEKHSQSYQDELRDTLVRLHKAEARLNDALRGEKTPPPLVNSIFHRDI